VTHQTLKLACPGRCRSWGDKNEEEVDAEKIKIEESKCFFSHA